MLFDRKEVYKVEWNVRRNFYVIALIEQYESGVFDSENDVFFESTGYIRRTEVAFSLNDDDHIQADINDWKVTIVTGKDALRKTFIRLFTSELGLSDIYSATELAERALEKFAV